MKQMIVNCETGETTEEKVDPVMVERFQAFEIEQVWHELRSRRNQLLTDSDWTVLGDSPTSTAAWKVYRQALRDLPANTTDPFNVDWPTPPA
jgi:hypothetical protein